jgi:Dolichyl-phosphate-mannose-protein mannosyltransferase
MGPAHIPGTMTGRDAHRPAAWIFALHVMLFGLLVWWSWRKWPDPFIDFGRELYVPWRLTQGAVLYRDVASLFGPLSPYVNALWFRLFGVSLLTLALCNIAIFAAMVAGIYYLIRTSTDRVTASAASLITIGLFGFSQYVAVGNYNFATPYSHEATHGLALAVAMLVSLYRGLVTHRGRWFAAAGLAFGLINLTKPEVIIAAAAAVLVGAAMLLWMRLHDTRWLLRRVSVFVAAAIVPPLMFFAFFVRHMPAGDAARAVAGAWTALNGELVTSPFYLVGSGLDAPLANTARMLYASAGFLLLVAGGILGASSTRSRVVFAGIAFVAASRPGALRALPLITLISLVAALMLVRRRLCAPLDALKLWPLVTWSAFALVLLAKIALNARIGHYGFCLALPATVTTVTLMCWSIPEYLNACGSEGRSAGFRQIALFTIAACAVPYLAVSAALYARKEVSIGSRGDRFMASSGRGSAFAEATIELQRLAPPTATIAVLPEGVMLNYLLRRQSPLRVVSAMPAELAAFGEDALLGSLAASPPDFVVLVRRQTSEYGVSAFGSEPRYGGRTMAWIRARYGPVTSIDNGEVDILARRSTW